MRHRLCTFVLLTILGMSASAAQAVPVIYDVVGIGQVCPVGIVMPACTQGVTFTGSVSIDVSAQGPSGPDSILILPESAYDLDSWVDPTFEFAWEGGSFAHRTVPGENIQDRLSSVYSIAETGEEAATTRKLSSRDGIVDGFRDSDQNWAQLDIVYGDLTARDILDVTAFPALDALPPTAVPSFWLRDLAFTVDYNIDQILTYTGYNAYFTATSIQARPPAAVPEPSTLALAGIGVLVLWISGYRRWRAASRR
jgi:hypothetical protein